MLTDREIEINKIKFIDLISTIKRPEANIDGFLNWLIKSDFFKAPASTKYHCNYPGGLCEHSLNVYNNLKILVEQFASHNEVVETEDGKSVSIVNNYSDDTIKLVALLHDISKTNFYERYYRNVKDDNGNWIQVLEYRIKDDADRFIYGSHEQNSEYMVSTFFPLSVEERSAILHHHGGRSWDSAQDDMASVFNKYPLATLLHLADMLSTFVNERQDAHTN